LPTVLWTESTASVPCEFMVKELFGTLFMLAFYFAGYLRC